MVWPVAGLTTGQIAMALRPAFAGVDAGDWIDPSGRNARCDGATRTGSATAAADIRNLPLVLPRGRHGRASRDSARTGCDRDEQLGPAQIDHLDREKVVTVGANVQGVPWAK